MIDPKDLEEFTEQLTKLVGYKLDEISGHIEDTKKHPYGLCFGADKRKNKQVFYLFTIADCAWQILKDRLVIFSFLGSQDEAERATRELEAILDKVVVSVEFNTNEFSLTILFEDAYALRLLHKSELNWHYEFSSNLVIHPLAGSGRIYQIEDDNLSIGTWIS